jgi:hypothetical protein
MAVAASTDTTQYNITIIMKRKKWGTKKEEKNVSKTPGVGI